MRKHGIAIAVGIIGAGIMGYISADSDTFILQVLSGLFIGMFIGYFIAGLMKSKSTLLQQDFQKLGNLQGLTLDEVINAVGNYKSFSRCNIKDRNNEQGYLYTWREDYYSITLLFDANNICIGVNSEITA